MIYNKTIPNKGVTKMNLKEAFRFQNKIESLISETENILGNEECAHNTKGWFKAVQPEFQQV